MSRENDLSQIETDRNLTEQQITTERGPDEIIAYPSQGVFVVPPEKWGPMKFPIGLSGSLTRLVDGTPYLIAGNNITITTGSKGQITIAAEGKISGTGGGGAGTSGTAASIITSSRICWPCTSCGELSVATCLLAVLVCKSSKDAGSH